jgi:hypothetical protein
MGEARPQRAISMHRILLAIAVTSGLLLTAGCSRQSTEPTHKTEGGSHFDRFKGAKPAANAKTKDKGVAPKAGGGGAGLEKRKRN